MQHPFDMSFGGPSTTAQAKSSPYKSLQGPNCS
jgi:hypothetical protein